jgi:predicted ATPase with chaperone activity
MPLTLGPLQAVTNAPQNYDYSWMKTLVDNIAVDEKGGPCRLVENEDQWHFEQQVLRYRSGLHLAITDTKLASLHGQITNEIQRRARIATNGHDAGAIIYGNELAKRALVVAAAGNHSLLLVGPPNCGKTMLRAVALELGLAETFVVRPCPCGYRNSPYHDCSCTTRRIERHLEKFPQADITVEMVLPAERDKRTPGTTLADMRRQIEVMSDHGSLDLDDITSPLFSHAVREIGLDPDVQCRIVAVARTIANLDRRERIDAPHLMEAVNYRAMRF